MANQLVLKTANGAATTHTLDDSGNATHTGAVTAAGLVSTGAMTTTRGKPSGTALGIGGLAKASVEASTAITGTTETETNFSEAHLIPPSNLTAGDVIHVVAQGIHTAQTGSETHDILLKLGSTTVCSKAGVDPAGGDLFFIEAWITIRTAGAGGTFVASGLIATGANGTAATTAWFKASTAVDTTGALSVAVAIDRQPAATDSDSARLDVFIVEILDGP